VVVANILAGPLQLMAPMLARVRAGGRWCCRACWIARPGSHRRLRALIALTVWAEHEGWVALAGRLPE
jgi:ribosomal protein L11 methyltransferase